MCVIPVHNAFPGEVAIGKLCPETAVVRAFTHPSYGLAHDFQNNLCHMGRFMGKHQVKLWWQHEVVAVCRVSKAVALYFRQAEFPVEMALDCRGKGSRELHGGWYVWHNVRVACGLPSSIGLSLASDSQALICDHSPHAAHPTGLPSVDQAYMQSTRTVTAREIARVLYEPCRFLVARALRVLGQDRCIELVTEALLREHQGGMLLKDL